MGGRLAVETPATAPSIPELAFLCGFVYPKLGYSCFELQNKN